MWLQWFAFHIPKEQGMICLNPRGGTPSKGFWLHRELFPLFHTTMQIDRQKPTGIRPQLRTIKYLVLSVERGQLPGKLDGKSWGDSYSLLKWVVSTKYFFAWKKVYHSRGFFQTVKLSNLLLIEVHLASLSGAGNRDLGFMLSLLRINFLFSAKGYLPHFVLFIIHGCTCWPF